jgi:hypothetical protein
LTYSFSVLEKLSLHFEDAKTLGSYSAYKPITAVAAATATYTTTTTTTTTTATAAAAL